MPYSISIDAIDLKYLPITNYSQKKKKTKLFDISSAKRHDYLEFEIFASEANDETNTGTILPVCTTICQICNITIPTCYITEHNQSNKHKMYKSITDNALDRVKKYLNEDYSVSDIKNLYDAYFCEVCCLALLENEKEIHEKSQSHCKALKKEKQLEDLLHLYSVSLAAVENEEGLDDFDSFTTAFDEDIGKSESKFVFEFNDSEAQKEENDITSIVEPEGDVKLRRRARNRSKKQLNPKFNSKSKEDDDAADSKVTTDVEPITQEQIFEQPTIIAPDGVVEIIFSEGTIVNVIEHQYHGFINSDNITICLPCNELVKNTVAHKTTSEKHLRIMKVPIKDTNCIRQIANNFNHCIICNEIFADVNAHLDSSKHHSKKHQAIGKDQHETDSIFENTSNSEHFETKNEIEIFFPNYYHLEVSENISNCIVCNVPVLNCLDLARRHVATKHHVAKYEETLEFNGLKESDDYSFSCEYCNIDGISKGTEFHHFLRASHVINLMKIEACKIIQDYMYPKKDLPFSVSSRTHPADFELSNFDNKSIVEPEVDIKLRRRARQRSKEQLNQKVNSKSKEADYKVTTDVESITPEEILEQPTIVVPDGVVEIMFPNGTIVNVIEYQYHGFINSDNITICLLCNELVKNTVAHKTTSEKHLRIMKVPIKDTNCIRQIANNFNHCIICNEIFADVNAHLFTYLIKHHSKKHQAIRNDQHKTHSIFENTWNSEHFEPKSEIVNHFPNYYHLEVSENISNCIVCNVPVLNCLDLARQHVANKYHVAKYEETLEFNGLTKGDDYSFSCKYCNIDGISKGTELHHFLDASHVINLMKTETCNIIQDYISPKKDLPLSVSSHTNPPDYELSNFDIPKLEPLSADKPKDVATKPIPKLSTLKHPDGICSTSIRASKDVAAKPYPKLSALKLPDGNYSTSIRAPKDIAAKPNPKLSALKRPDGIYSTSIKATVNCVVCEVNLPNTLRNINEHIQSTKHKTKYNGFLKHNQIDKLIDKIVCRVCKVSLKYKEITKHVKYSKHECNLKMSKHEAKEWITETKNKKRVLCQICKASIINQIDCIYEHVNGKNHNTNWSSYLKKNELIKNGENYFCEACNISVILSLKEHSQSQSHKEMITNKNLKYVNDKGVIRCFCCICGVHIPNHENNIADHKNGNLHRSNLKNKIIV